MSEEWEYEDFVWTDDRLSYGIVQLDMVDNARAEWWEQVQPIVMGELQPWLNDGWEPTSTIGPNCWELATIRVPAYRFWSTQQWIFWALGLFAMVFLPLLLLLESQTIVKPVGIRVPLRRQTYKGLASQILGRIDVVPETPYWLSGYGFSSIADAVEIYLSREGNEHDRARIALEHFGPQVIPALISAGVSAAVKDAVRLVEIHHGKTIIASRGEGLENALDVVTSFLDTIGADLANNIASLVVSLGQDGVDRLCRCIYRDDPKLATLAALALHMMPNYSRQTMILLDELKRRLEQRLGDDDPGRITILVTCAMAKGGSQRAIRYLKELAQQFADKEGMKWDEQLVGALVVGHMATASLYLIDVKMPIDRAMSYGYIMVNGFVEA